MSLFKAASTVSLMTLASRISGLVRDLLMASMFGANALTDAFNVAFRIPNLFRRLFAEGAFSQAFVPVLAASKTKNGEDATRQLIGHVATILFWSLLVVCVLGVVGAPLLCEAPQGDEIICPQKNRPKAVLMFLLTAHPLQTADDRSHPCLREAGIKQPEPGS